MHDPTEPLAWVARAAEDLALARSARRRKTPLTYGVTFHAQQCAEKYLKALLLARHQVFPRTHDLAALSDLCLQAELETAARFSINTVILVNNNHSLNHETRLFDAAYGWQQRGRVHEMWGRSLS